MIERKNTPQKIRRRRSVGTDETKWRKSRNRLQGRSSAPPSGMKSCLQFLLVSSVIPLLFFLRMSQQDEDSYLRRRYSLSLPAQAEVSPPFDFLPDMLRIYAEKLRQSTVELDQEWLDSDVAELHHCHSIFMAGTSPQQSMNWTDFTEWARPLVLNISMPQLKRQRPNMAKEDEDILREEIIVELLEIYGTQHGYCKFHRYQPTFVHGGDAFSSMSATQKIAPPPVGHARLAFVIAVRRHDPTHIKRLIRAIHLPYHYIVLHVDMQMDEQIQTDLLEIAQYYDNVVVVRFGTVHPGMDGMTNIHLKLMRWLTLELHLRFEYHITLDGASFPLHSAEQLAQQLRNSTNSVWLGTLTEQGSLVRECQQRQLNSKRLVTTSIPEMATMGIMFEEPNLPSWLHCEDTSDGYLNYKTVSGGNAVFSQPIIRQLLSSSRAMEIFGLSKYGCCRLDNYNWMAAMQALDKKGTIQNELSAYNEAKTQTATFQLFAGGTDGNCESSDDSEKTAMLTMDKSRCYRIEHPSVVKAVHTENYTSPEFDWSIPQDRRYVHGGDELVKYLQAAKTAGFLFASQFDSTNPHSVALLDKIEKAW